MLGWSSSTTDPATIDTAIRRTTAGNIAIDAASVGRYGEVKANYVVTYGVSDTGFNITYNRVTLASTDRASFIGTGRVHMSDIANRNEYLPGKAVFNPPAFIIRSGELLMQYKRMWFAGNERGTLTEDARIILNEPDAPMSRLVLVGRW